MQSLIDKLRSYQDHMTIMQLRYDQISEIKKLMREKKISPAMIIKLDLLIESDFEENLILAREIINSLAI